jgi:colanic acid/amylovoran biosynthesis glycosyltransferase
VRKLIGPVAYVVSLKDGIPSFTKREIDGLAARGLEIHLYATKTGHGVYEPENGYVSLSLSNLVLGIAYYLFLRPRGFFSNLALASRTRTLKEFGAGAAFARVMSSRKTKLIHCTFGDRKLSVGYYASRLIDRPFTVMIHSHELTLYVDKRIFREAVIRASMVFTVCEYNKKILAEKIPEISSKIRVQRLFVDPEEFSTQMRTRILTVAKFHEYKGYDILAKAASLLKNKDFIFWIVGDGPLDVREMFRKEGVENKAIFFGAVGEDELKVLYEECDIFCLPSKTAASGQKEGLPVTLMEAMAFAKPVVSTLHAGIPELVPSQLVSEGDPEGLARALTSYAENRDRMSIDGQRNRAIVLRDYSRRNLEGLDSEFRRILES